MAVDDVAPTTSAWTSRRGWRASMAIAAALLTPLIAVSHVTTARAAPRAPTTLFSEDFENVPSTAPVLLTDYVGATGQRYTADPAWLRACNGVIVSFNSPNTALAQSGCTARTAALNRIAYASVRQMAWALGSFRGLVDPSTKRAVTAYTDGEDPGPNKVQFATVNPIPLAATGRFLSFTVDAAEENCTVANRAHAMFQFYLVDNGVLRPAFTSAIDPCTAPTTITAPALDGNAAAAVRVGTFTANRGVLFTGTTVGIEMINAEGSGLGNDAAFSIVGIVDVTPQLDKAFSAPNASGVSTLTLTVTNTTDLGAKDGWSFTDALPAGLAVASPNGVSTDCSAGVVTAPAGGTTISGAGNLELGRSSCTLTVNVVGTEAGTFTDGPTNMTSLVGLNPPGTSSVTYTPSIAITKRAGTVTDANGDGILDAGDTIAYTFDVTNNGTLPLDIDLTDNKVGAITCPQPTLAPGASQTCATTVPYALTPADIAAGQVINTATVVGTVPGTTTTVAASDTVTTPLPTRPSLLLVKEAGSIVDVNGNGRQDAGDQITFTFRVTNNGDVALSDMGVTDSKVGPVACPTTSLDFGPTVICTATYTLTQADVDAGVAMNVATAHGTPEGSTTTVESSPASTTTPIDQVASLSLVKRAGSVVDANHNGRTDAGDTISYTFTVTNTGNVTLSAVGVTDSLLGPVTCPSATLAGLARMTCSGGPRTLTERDFAFGSVTNTAAALGLPPGAQVPVTSDPATAIVPLPKPNLVTPLLPAAGMPPGR